MLDLSISNRRFIMLSVWLKRICFLTVFVTTSVLIATVTVHNETDGPLYAGIYYYAPDGIAQLQTAVLSIDPHEQVDIEEPSISLLYDRYLIVDIKQDLEPTLSYE